jgi:hypothetical protein
MKPALGCWQPPLHQDDPLDAVRVSHELNDGSFRGGLAERERAGKSALLTAGTVRRRRCPHVSQRATRHRFGERDCDHRVGARWQVRAVLFGRPGVLATVLSAVGRVRPSARSEVARSRRGRLGSPDAVVKLAVICESSRRGLLAARCTAADSMRLGAPSSRASEPARTCRQHLDRR